MMIRGFFTTFLMKHRLGMLGLGKASLGLGLFFISIYYDLSFCHCCKDSEFPPLSTHFLLDLDKSFSFGNAHASMALCDKILSIGAGGLVLEQLVTLDKQLDFGMQYTPSVPHRAMTICRLWIKEYSYMRLIAKKM